MYKDNRRRIKKKRGLQNLSFFVYLGLDCVEYAKKISL